MPLYLLPGVRLEIRLTEARPSFYLINKSVDSKTVFKFLDAQLLVRRVRPNPAILLAHNSTLNKGSLARYNLMRVELKTFTFSAGSKSLSIDNAVLGPIQKRLLFTMVKNRDFIGSLDNNPYKLQHYDISDFSLFLNGKQFPNEGLTLGMDHEKTSVMCYRTLFEASGIHHSNTGLQITHNMYINGYFMLLFDLTPDRGTSEGHKSHPENGNIRIELKFNKPLPKAIMCLLYLEFDNKVLIYFARTVMTASKMDTVQILCTLCDVSSFLDVFPSDLLPQSIAQTSTTVIVNADPHTEGGSHWLAVHFRLKSSSAYYFDSCGIVPLVPSIQAFIKCNCTTWDYNRRQLQGLTTDVCGTYCCLFALYMDRGYTPKQFISLYLIYVNCKLNSV